MGGAHGHFLEYMCNKFCTLVDNKLMDFLPFKHNGTSHITPKDYNKYKLFVLADSLCGIDNSIVRSFNALRNNKVAYIELNEDDLLQFMQISFLRAAETNRDSNLLDVNTYSKLSRFDFGVIDNIKEFFFQDTIKNDYNAVKDPTWPDINNISDYYALPKHIITECNDIHGITPLELSQSNPDCPRRILREFFTYGFIDTSTHGMLLTQQKLYQTMPYLNNDIFKFKFNVMYNTQLFKDEVIRLFEFYDMQETLDLTDEFEVIHMEFLTKQPYKNSKSKCDAVISNILHETENMKLDLLLLEQSYVNAIVELSTGVSLHRDTNEYFVDTAEIKACLL